MNNRRATILIIVLLLVFLGYIVIDVTMKQSAKQKASPPADTTVVSDQWIVSKVFEPGKGELHAVAASNDGKIIIGGEPFVACYDPDFRLLWEFKTEMPVTALTVSGNKVYAATQDIILVLNMMGEKTDEWGPYEENAIITSVTGNNSYIVFADAAHRKVFVLDKKGLVRYMIGSRDDPFVIPSPYFDVALDNRNILYVANTGKKRIEKRRIDGTMMSFTGESGTDKETFCGCCNPAHFILFPGGFVTAEKGINRIKILNEKGEFVEYVSSVNRFVPPLPLDLASGDGKVIYGANPADSKLYVFTRK